MHLPTFAPSENTDSLENSEDNLVCWIQLLSWLLYIEKGNLMRIEASATLFKKNININDSDKKGFSLVLGYIW